MDLFLIYLPSFLILLTVLVFIHELGHYWVARRCGVRIEVFSIGFGQEIVGWTDKAGTRWKISALPLGGYVKMFGEGAYSGGGASEHPITAAERAVSFSHKGLIARAAIVFAGPAANYIFAIFILSILYMTIGQPYTPASVGTVVPGSVAEAAGLLPGDEFVSVDGTTVTRFRDLQQVIGLHPEEPLEIVLRRDGREIKLTITPRADEEVDISGHKVRIGRLGITQKSGAYKRSGPVGAVWEAVSESVRLTTGTFVAIGQMFTARSGSVNFQAKRHASALFRIFPSWRCCRSTWA